MQGKMSCFLFMKESEGCTMSFPVYQTGITLQELPNMISFYIQFSECSLHCVGCHSSYLWGKYNNRKPLNWIIDRVLCAKDDGADAIILFGDINNNISTEDLCALCKELSEILPICIYSGADDILSALGSYSTLKYIKWLKLGHYSKTAGPLDCDTTNQHMYLVEADGLVDITKKLFKKE